MTFERLYLWLGVAFSIVLFVKLDPLLEIQRTRGKFSYNGGNNFMKHQNILVYVQFTPSKVGIFKKFSQIVKLLKI